MMNDINYSKKNALVQESFDSGKTILWYLENTMVGKLLSTE